MECTYKLQEDVFQLNPDESLSDDADGDDHDGVPEDWDERGELSRVKLKPSKHAQ